MSNITEDRLLKLLNKELDRPISNIDSLVTMFCELMECKNCPVVLENYDKRSKYEKTCLHEPCVRNLIKWVKDKCITEYVERLKEEYSILQGENSEICKEVFNRFDKIKEELIGNKS